MRYVIERRLENYRYEYAAIDRQTAAAFAGEDALREIENNTTAREMRAMVLVERRDEDGNTGRVGVDFGAEDTVAIRLTRHEVCDLMLACCALRDEANKWEELRAKLRRFLDEYDRDNS